MTQQPIMAASLASRREQIYPVLNAAQVARFAAFGVEQAFTDGALVWDQGDAGVACYLVLAGALEIVHPECDSARVITTHEAGEFTGEVALLNDRRSLVRAVAVGDLRVLKVEPLRFKALIQTDSELSELILRAFILRRVNMLAGGIGDVVVIGSRDSPATLRLQGFLVRNSHPYRVIDVDVEPDIQATLDHFHVAREDVPILICRGERVLKNPSDSEVAECLGFNNTIDPDVVRDVVICGAGPGGLAAAVYGASEGLDTLVIESSSPGGQAASSSKIENYFGFPTGISGQALLARGLTQAEKFGAQLVVASGAVRLHCGEQPLRIELASGQSIRTRTVVIATGVEYRKLTVANLERFERAGVYYSATAVESQRCGQDEVIVVGGGNSAGQAATYLARTSKKVHILIRGQDLASSMSRYLIRRIEDIPNIELHNHTEIVALDGDKHLETVSWRDARGSVSSHPIRHVFSMTGASPNTGWLDGCVALDDKGFVLTGSELPSEQLTQFGWSKPRAPHLFETSRHGVFAVGDVRANSVKRVASAVGEGSVCIQLVHKALVE